MPAAVVRPHIADQDLGQTQEDLDAQTQRLIEHARRLDPENLPLGPGEWQADNAGQQASGLACETVVMVTVLDLNLTRGLHLDALWGDQICVCTS